MKRWVWTTESMPNDATIINAIDRAAAYNWVIAKRMEYGQKEAEAKRWFDKRDKLTLINEEVTA